MSVNGSTSALRLSERRNFRRPECDTNPPQLPLTFAAAAAAGAAGARTNGGVLQVRVHVPGHALGRYLRMLAQKIERIRGSLGVDSFGDIQSGLRGSFGLQSFAAVQNGEIVVRGQIVRINGLQRLKLCHGVIRAMLLVVGNA